MDQLDFSKCINYEGNEALEKIKNQSKSDHKQIITALLQ